VTDTTAKDEINDFAVVQLEQVLGLIKSGKVQVLQCDFAPLMPICSVIDGTVRKVWSITLTIIITGEANENRDIE
jgi:hypothetical protein